MPRPGSHCPEVGEKVGLSMCCPVSANAVMPIAADMTVTVLPITASRFLVPLPQTSLERGLSV